MTPDKFYTSLKNVLSKKGITLDNEYTIDGHRVDLYELYQTVIVKGSGGDRVTQEMRWSDMARFVPGLQPLSKSKKALAALSNLYNRVLAPFEVAWGTALLAQRDKLLHATAAAEAAKFKEPTGTTLKAGEVANRVQAPFPALPIRRSSKDREGVGRRGLPISALEWGSSDKAASISKASALEARFQGHLEVPQEREEENSSGASPMDEAHRRKRTKSTSGGVEALDFGTSPTTSATGSATEMSTASTQDGTPSSARSAPTPAAPWSPTENQSAAAILAATPSVDIASDAVDAASAWLLDQPGAELAGGFDFDMESSGLPLDLALTSTDISDWTTDGYQATLNEVPSDYNLDLWDEVGLPRRYMQADDDSIM